MLTSLKALETVYFHDFGTVDYQEAWTLQEKLFNEVVGRKLSNRLLKKENQEPPQHFLLFCEHPHVYTLGRSGDKNNLIVSEDELLKLHATFYRNNRGGDITYHGPGQIVGYPIFDLDEFFTDVHRYVRYLEEAVMLTLAEYGIEDAYRIKEYTGVWLPQKGWLPKRKICAIGVHLSRWVTMHGFAFNVNTDLGYFRHIVPCGINDGDKDVTSLAKELGHTIDENEVKEKLRRHFSELFGFEFA